MTSNILIYSAEEITQIPDWHKQLAQLLSTAWRGKEGVTYAPYPELTDPDHWKQVIVRKWKDEQMISWVATRDEQILSHAGIVSHGDHWELGRLAVLAQQQRGLTTTLFNEAVQFLRDNGLYAFIEGTTSHSRSQWMAYNAGWRCAGVGYSGNVHGKEWDVVLWDNYPTPDFTPKVGVVGNPRGVDIPLNFIRAQRLRAIGEVTGDRTIEHGQSEGRFHTLPHIVESIKETIRLNT